MTTKYFAVKPFKHGRTYYRAGDEITGFTGWWRYWQLLRYRYVNKVDTTGAPVLGVITPGSTTLSLAVTGIAAVGGDPWINFEYKLDQGAWTAFKPVDVESPFTITGLTNGTTYAVRVRGINAAGAGTASNSVNGIPATTPALPTALAATPLATTVSIAFTAGDSGGHAISNYQYKVGTGAWTALSPADAATPVTVPGLTTGTAYSVLLRAVNDMGAGAQSAALTFTTDSVPAAPTALAATVGNETVSIAFTPGSDNGAAISAYQYTLNNGTDWFGTTPATTASPMVLTMPNDVEYTVKIRAINAVGNGVASAAVVFTPAHQVPAAPTGLTATPSALAVSIAFTAPNMNGGALVEYEHSFNNGTDWFGTTPDTIATPYLMTLPANDYTVVLRAVNDVGNGPKSAPVTFTVPGDPGD